MKFVVIIRFHQNKHKFWKIPSENHWRVQWFLPRRHYESLRALPHLPRSCGCGRQQTSRHCGPSPGACTKIFRRSRVTLGWSRPSNVPCNFWIHKRQFSDPLRNVWRKPKDRQYRINSSNTRGEASYLLRLRQNEQLPPKCWDATVCPKSPIIATVIVNAVARAIANRINEFVRLPTQEEEDEMALKFHEKYGFPCVRGVIDGTHFEIKKPSQNQVPEPDAFYCRKGYFSINAMMLADFDKKIRFFSVRYPGKFQCLFKKRLHPATLFDLVCRIGSRLKSLSGVQPCRASGQDFSASTAAFCPRGWGIQVRKKHPYPYKARPVGKSRSTELQQLPQEDKNTCGARLRDAERSLPMPPLHHEIQDRQRSSHNRRLHSPKQYFNWTARTGASVTARDSPGWSPKSLRSPSDSRRHSGWPSIPLSGQNY